MDGKLSGRLTAKASKSVVIVAIKKSHDAYCSGCVIDKCRRLPGSAMPTTVVLAPTEFVKGQENRLKVVFYDKREVKATVLAVFGQFCLLSAEYHSGCEMIRFADTSDLKPGRTFMVVPHSNTATKPVRTYATVESLKSYTLEGTLVADSDQYFMVACNYLEKTGNGINRLTAAPVFTMFGRTMGIVLQECRHAINDAGREMKVTLNPREAEKLIDELKRRISHAKGSVAQIPRASGKKRKWGGQ